MERVAIFGASSAIAAEVAVLHAQRGDRVHLVGRTAAKLEAVVERCRAVAREPITSAVADLGDLARADAGCPKLRGSRYRRAP